MALAQTLSFDPKATIWRHPRRTIQAIIDTDPTRSVLMLTALMGIAEMLRRAVSMHMSDQYGWPWIVVLSVVWGPLLQAVGLYLSAALLSVTGRWIGARGNAQQLRAAIAWSRIPAIWSIAVWGVGAALFGEVFFTEAALAAQADSPASLVAFGMRVWIVVLQAWSAVLYAECVAQVQGFSAWRALLNTFLAAMVLIVPGVLVLLALSMLFG